MRKIVVLVLVLAFSPFVAAQPALNNYSFI
jgi:hypothetical protein